MVPLRRQPVGGAPRARRMRRRPAEPRPRTRQRCRMARAHRTVLRPRPDAARRRRTHRAPTDHVAGLHPRPHRPLYRVHAPGDREDPRRLEAQRRFPRLPGHQGTHPRPRHLDLHGWGRRFLGARNGRGQRGVHRVCAGVDGHCALPTARHPMAKRSPGPRPTRGVLPPLPARTTCARRRRPVLGAVPRRIRRR